jgi:uncharacterized membrane-anchored protein
MIPLPADHDQRRLLNDEVHARPPDAYVAPTRTSFLAMFSEGLSRDAGSAPIRDLAHRFGLPPPDPEANHFSADLGPFRVTWERHTEFSRYSFVEAGDGQVNFEMAPARLVPRDWLSNLPGRTLVAANLILVRDLGRMPEVDTISAQYFAGNILIGAQVSDAAATALTDFRVYPDGFSRMLVFDHGLAPRQAGRTVQRLLEIDAYRLLATMALPVARELTPFLARSESDLAEITAAMTTARTAEEPMLLDRLIQLEAEIESRRSTTVNRFNAATAYYDLVQRRIEELRESRLPGLQTFKELTERRLVPAMNTCKAVSTRQDALSLRVTRATQLLSTRVDITREEQNQDILESMNRRAKLQLRLQQTVEGLSIAAVTYYVVGLVAYIAKGLSAAGVAIKADVVTAISIPVIALLVASGLRHLRSSFGPAASRRPSTPLDQDQPHK